MTTHEIIKMFDEEFTYKSSDGKTIPIEFDPDKELKEKFIMFLLKVIKQIN